MSVVDQMISLDDLYVESVIEWSKHSRTCQTCEDGYKYECEDRHKIMTKWNERWVVCRTLWATLTEDQEREFLDRKDGS